jgi:hypothetical protein
MRHLARIKIIRISINDDEMMLMTEGLYCQRLENADDLLGSGRNPGHFG